MVRIRYALLGMALIALAGCGRADKENTETQPVVQPAPPQAAPESAAPVAAPEPAKPTPTPAEPSQTKAKPRAAKSAPKPTAPAPAAATQPEPPAPPKEAPTAPSSPQVAESPAAPVAAPKAPEPRYASIPSGTSLQVRLQEPLSSAANKAGDQFIAILDKDIVVDGVVVVHRGSTVEGKVSQAERSGRVQGRASMSLQLVNLIVNNQPYALQTEPLSFEAESTKKKDATKVGIGAGLGAVIGAIAGGGKGAAIGAAVGGGAGGATVIATRGEEVKFESEHVFDFVLQHEVSVRLR